MRIALQRGATGEPGGEPSSSGGVVPAGVRLGEGCGDAVKRFFHKLSLEQKIINSKAFHTLRRS